MFKKTAMVLFGLALAVAGRVGAAGPLAVTSVSCVPGSSVVNWTYSASNPSSFNVSLSYTYAGGKGAAVNVVSGAARSAVMSPTPNATFSYVATVKAVGTSNVATLRGTCTP